MNYAAYEQKLSRWSLDTSVYEVFSNQSENHTGYTPGCMQNSAYSLRN